MGATAAVEIRDGTATLVDAQGQVLSRNGYVRSLAGRRAWCEGRDDSDVITVTFLDRQQPARTHIAGEDAATPFLLTTFIGHGRDEHLLQQCVRCGDWHRVADDDLRNAHPFCYDCHREIAWAEPDRSDRNRVLRDSGPQWRQCTCGAWYLDDFKGARAGEARCYDCTQHHRGQFTRADLAVLRGEDALPPLVEHEEEDEADILLRAERERTPARHIAPAANTTAVAAAPAATSATAIRTAVPATEQDDSCFDARRYNRPRLNGPAATPATVRTAVADNDDGCFSSRRARPW